MSLPVLIEEEIEALIEVGRFSSREDFVEEAIRFFLQVNVELRIDAAIKLYLDKEVSLGRAAEIAGLHIEEFKSVLKSRGIKIIVEAPSEEQMKRETELMRKRK